LSTAIRGAGVVEKGTKIILRIPEKQGPRVAKTWGEVFDTADRNEVESICQARGIDFFWNPDNSLHMILTRPATIEHPITRKTIWFNQAHIFHNSDYSRRQRFYHKVKASLLHFIESLYMRTQDPKNNMTHCTFGDGTEIPVEYIKHISSVLEALSVINDWRQGGVLVLDNLRIAHGRMPFKGSRQILFTLSDPLSLSDNGREQVIN